MNNLWESAFLDPLKEFVGQLGTFLPHMFAMIVIITLGILAALALKFIFFRILKAVKFDQLCGRMGLTETLQKGGIRETPSHMISRMVYWVIVLTFLMLGVGALKLTPVDQFVSNVLSYLPHLMVAVVVLIVGFLLANFFSRATLIAAVNAQVTQARLLARGVHLAIILFALAMAFVQMGIATTIIVAAFSISFGGLVMAVAIAFGLGAKDAAKEFIEKRIKAEAEPEAKEEDFSHL